MTPRTDSDEKYILDLVAEILLEPEYRWQHRFPTLLGDPGKDGRRRALPVDGYFPRHRLIVEYWEMQHSAPVPIMDRGMTVSGVSRGHQRRHYDQRRQAWAEANDMRFVVLDYRGFDTDDQGRLRRDRARDQQRIASALQAAGVMSEPSRRPPSKVSHPEGSAPGCSICGLASGDREFDENQLIWQDSRTIVYLKRHATVYGHTLVAPTAHLEQATGDFSLHGYLELQRVVHAVGEAVRLALKPEKVHILSTGWEMREDHLQWHIVPCPRGIPQSAQQLSLMDPQERGVLHLGQEESLRLARSLRAHLPAWMQEPKESS